MEQTPQLNPSDLYDKRRATDAARLRAYNKILEQIYNRVRTISKLPNSQCNLLYTIPPFILGLPKIDLEDCVVYLVYQLRHGGYEVRYTPPTMLYVSWLHHEKSYLTEQSPIMQAMMESAEKTAAELERKEREAARLLGPGKKTQRKNVKQSPGVLQSISGPARPTSAPITAINTILNRNNPNPTAGPPPPAAGDYVPPATFLQNIAAPPNEVVYPKSVPEYFRR
jgi:hypothetical protein